MLVRKHDARVLDRAVARSCRDSISGCNARNSHGAQPLNINRRIEREAADATTGAGQRLLAGKDAHAAESLDFGVVVHSAVSTHGLRALANLLAGVAHCLGLARFHIDGYALERGERRRVEHVSVAGDLCSTRFLALARHPDPRQ